jgi:hypothetical protein
MAGVVPAEVSFLPLGGGELAEVEVAGAGLVADRGGGVGVGQAVAGDPGSDPAQPVIGEGSELGLGIGLGQEPAGIVVAVGPGAEIGADARDAAAERIVGVGPEVAHRPAGQIEL